jgi:hypothetical protein
MLDGGGLPRWAGWVAVLAAVAVGAALFATQVSRPGAPPRASSRSSGVVPAPRPSPDDVLDVAAGVDGTWVLTGGALSLVDGTHAVRRTSLVGAALPAGSAPILAVDRTAGRVWIVVAAAAPSELIEYDAASLQLLRRIVWPVFVHGAVGYQGHLYLATDLGTADLAPDARAPQLIAGLSAADGPIALDPVRQRVIAMNVGYPTRIWTYRPGRYPVRAGVALPFGGGTIAVVGGAIWVGGFTDRHGVLDRLDARTLHPALHAGVGPFGPGAVIMSGGARVLWVRAGNGTDLLACVDARTGRVEQHWHVPGLVAVASRAGVALVGTQRVAYAPILSGCSG